MAVNAHAESILFAIDVDAEMGAEVAKGLTRLQLVANGLSHLIEAKSRVNSAHCFGLAALTDTAHLLLPELTNQSKKVTSRLQSLTPSAESFTAFEVGSLVELARAVQRQVQGALRLVVVYGRSCVVPTWTSNLQGAVAVDAVYLHDRGPEGARNIPQEVYGLLEEWLDVLSLRAGHSAYIFETPPSRKLSSTLLDVLRHPAQRCAQSALTPPVDMATCAHAPLPNDWPTLSSTGAAPGQAPTAYAAGLGLAPTSPSPGPSTTSTTATAAAVALAELHLPGGCVIPPPPHGPAGAFAAGPSGGYAPGPSPGPAGGYSAAGLAGPTGGYTPGPVGGWAALAARPPPQKVLTPGAAAAAAAWPPARALTAGAPAATGHVVALAAATTRPMSPAVPGTAAQPVNHPAAGRGVTPPGAPAAGKPSPGISSARGRQTGRLVPEDNTSLYEPPPPIL